LDRSPRQDKIPNLGAERKRQVQKADAERRGQVQQCALNRLNNSQADQEYQQRRSGMNFPLKEAAFAAFGVAQAVYLLLHGHILFYIFYPFLGGLSLAACDTNWFFEVHSAALLTTYSLPNVAAVRYLSPHTNGSVASFDVTYEDCVRPRLILQSAAPVEWFLAGNTMHLKNATQFSQFRVIAFCENVKRPIIGSTVFIDDFSLRYCNTWKAEAADPEHARELVPLARGAREATENPFYRYGFRDWVVVALWAVSAGRAGWDWLLLAD
jgi:hypothetical protein